MRWLLSPATFPAEGPNTAILDGAYTVRGDPPSQSRAASSTFFVPSFPIRSASSGFASPTADSSDARCTMCVASCWSASRRTASPFVTSKKAYGPSLSIFWSVGSRTSVASVDAAPNVDRRSDTSCTPSCPVDPVTRNLGILSTAPEAAAEAAEAEAAEADDDDDEYLRLLVIIIASTFDDVACTLFLNIIILKSSEVYVFSNEL
mmetsp:Transcript_5316/g.13449  ORF Transcript_5316/g.13449 Transcript_5316/m.13449 type:complete len:205 (+) Transcript_5316:2483-3097(+)